MQPNHLSPNQQNQQLVSIENKLQNAKQMSVVKDRFLM
jgi:hypothetical protein